MFFAYSDGRAVSKTALARTRKLMQSYYQQFTTELAAPVPTAQVAPVTTWKDESMLEEIYSALAKFKKPKAVVLVGIGGSSLGTEAVHAALATNDSPELHVLDTIAPHELERVLLSLKRTRHAKEIAICVVSKSGATVETLANAEVLIGSLEARFGHKIWEQVICISDAGSLFLKRAKKKGARTVAIPLHVGGRFSVFTPVGLVPLALLGHNIETFLAGAEDAVSTPHVENAFTNAARLQLHLVAGMRHYTFFAFDTRLVRLGKWYRQLTAESLGKEKTRHGQPVTYGFVPSIVTAVDLHSIGQLFFARFPGVYTDFVTFNDDTLDYRIPARPILATALAKKTHQDIAAAMYAGVIEAYQTRRLPYRATIFEEDLTYSLGLFMASRMVEVIALAELLDVNAFDQPNVELYKTNIRTILGL